MSDSSKKGRAKRILLIISIVIAAVFMLQILGKPIVAPFPAHLNFESPSAFCFGEKGSVIADRSGTRLLFLDSENKLDSFIILDDAAFIDNAYFIATDGQYFYLSGSKYAKNSDDVDYDRVVRYDTDGKHPSIVYEIDRREDHATYHSVGSLDVSDHHLNLAFVDYKTEETVRAVDVDMSRPDADPETLMEIPIPDFYCAKYNADSQCLYVNNLYGQLFKISRDDLVPREVMPGSMVYNFLPIHQDDVVWLDGQNNDLKRNQQTLIEDSSMYFNFSFCNNEIIFDHFEDDGLTRLDLSDGTVTDMSGVDYTFGFACLTMVRWISVLYLAILVLILLFKGLKNAYKAHNYELLKKVGIIGGLMVMSVAIALFYTFNITRIQYEEMEADIEFQTALLSSVIDEQMIEDAVITPDGLSDPAFMEKYTAAYDRLARKFSVMEAGSEKNVKNAYFQIMKKEGKNLIVLYDTWGDSVLGSGVDYDFLFPPEGNEGLQVRLKSELNLYYQAAPILNAQGETIGAVIYGQNYNLSNETIIDTCMDMAITLLTIAITIYLIVTECGGFIKGLRKRREIKQSGKLAHSEVVMLRTITFVLFVAINIDSIVLVPVTMSLLENSGIASSSFLLALPALLIGIGDVMGIIIYNYVSGRINVKKLAVMGCAIIFFCQITNIFAIAVSNYILFCIVKLIMGTGIFLILGITITMRVKPEKEEERFYANKAYFMGRVSGIIFAALISGFIVQKFNSIIIYSIAAVMVIPLVILLMRFLPSKTRYVQKNTSAGKEGKGQLKRIFSYFREIPVLSYLFFVVVPIMIIQGYQGYLFPIYSSAVAMPTMYITAFFALSRAILMALSDSIAKLLKEVDHWNILVFCVGLIGIAFLGFYINSSIFWAVIMLIITGSVESIAMPAMGVVWVRQAEARGLPLDRISNIMSIWEELVCALKETILSCFLLFGNQWACIVVGIFCLAAIILFALLTRKSPMAVSA